MDELSKAEQNNQEPLGLLSPGYWAALICFSLILLAGIFFAFLGSIPIRVKGEGLVFNPDRIFHVDAPSEGQVKDIVHLNDPVLPGGVIAEITPDQKVVADRKGIVFDLEVSPGQMVAAGEPLIWLQTEGDGLQVAGLIPRPESEQVKIGMEAEVTLESADPALYGRLRGKVIQIIPFWTSQAHHFIPTMHLPISSERDQYRNLIVIELTPDAKTASGYRWTSGNGAPFVPKLGTPCTFSVIIENKKPISYLIP